MSLRKKLLYRFSPTYRNSLHQKELLNSIHEIIKPFQNLSDIINEAQNHKMLELVRSITKPSQQIDPMEKRSLHDYVSMQKNHYDDENITPDDIVGQYEWHENFPYETFLLYKYGDIRFPIFDSFKNKKALDFGCGPGRMVKRMNALFDHTDGCDISQRLLEVAKDRNPNSNFYHTDGKNLGNTPENFYDFIYCTISMQHIASHSIRKSILENIFKCLKKGGKITLQMAYNSDFPYVQNNHYIINDKKIVVKERGNQANYLSDDYHAFGTNGCYDVGIGENDIPAIKQDFLTLFSDVELWFANVNNYYKNLKGHKHGEYWANDWIFIHAQKE